MAGIVASGPVGRVTSEDAAGASDEELLEGYLTASEPEAQTAFRALVDRHGPMVLGTCRQVLHHAQDAEDAFQATFLKLARKGATIRNRRALAGWLHEVAVRTACRLRDGSARRRAAEKPSEIATESGADPATVDPSHRLAWDELRPVLHEEVNRLPEKYRAPVVLSYLEGRTNEEAAALLHWPVGTLKVRLLRARDLLRARLSRRGVGLSAALLATGLHQARAMADPLTSGLAGKVVGLAMEHRLAGRTRDAMAASPVDNAVTSRSNAAFKGRGPLKSSRLARIGLLFLLIFLAVLAGNSLAVTITGSGLAELPAVRRILAMRFDFAWTQNEVPCH